MTQNERDVRGVAVPPLLYGTAWKEERTRDCVARALAAGFRGIDTANQRRHYHEAGVGEAIGAAIEAGTVSRDDLFVQTKFTPRPGQDHRLPYDPEAPPDAQVRQSFARSLEHLGLERLDSLVLHGPTYRDGLTDEDWARWRAMEALHAEGATRLLGVSNVSAGQLEVLLDGAEVAPAFVQNRCFAARGWDADVRRVASARGVVYQGFSLLTANQRELARPEVASIAARHAKTVPQVVFRFAHQLGMIPLTGTTSDQHMAEDLDVFDFALDEDEVAALLG
ncbi:MAG TPA: aldo/keto reductase [Sandaracinaceae bacterium LLY-WYZ-13_1]|nr:aldo/keto reductase [Sandaracinaceae bacterium LLY-WYZ-13_1]